MVRILAVITTLILFASTSLPAFAQTPVNAFQMEFLAPIQQQTDHAIFETAALNQSQGALVAVVGDHYSQSGSSSLLVMNRTAPTFIPFGEVSPCNGQGGLAIGSWKADLFLPNNTPGLGQHVGFMAQCDYVFGPISSDYIALVAFGSQTYQFRLAAQGSCSYPSTC